MPELACEPHEVVVAVLAPDSETAAYRASHQDLLVPICGPQSVLDSSLSEERALLLGDRLGGDDHRRPYTRGGILLPISRSFSQPLPGLSLAAELALAHRCRLIVICSRQARSTEFPELLKTDLGDLLVLVDLDDVPRAWLPKLASSSHPVSRLRRANDVGSKRNIGLEVAVTLGWDYLLFVDDDIFSDVCGEGEDRSLDSESLSDVLAEMESRKTLLATGWTLESFDDNSVVGHARTLLGWPQKIFIGGGALLVRCSADVPFFPDIYNEDWLFLIALAGGAPGEESVLARAGHVRQLPYSPFRPKRAASEEAGEMIGEGLMNSLEDHGPKFLDNIDAAYWEALIASRYELLESIRGEAEVLAVDDARQYLRRQCLESSMQAAKYVHREIDLVGKQFIELCRLARALNPEAEGIEMRPSSSAAALALQSFVETWRGDLLNWRPQLLSIQSRLGQNITEGDLCRALTGREPTTQQSRIPAQTVMVAGESDWASADKVEWLVREPQLESA